MTESNPSQKSDEQLAREYAATLVDLAPLEARMSWDSKKAVEKKIRAAAEISYLAGRASLRAELEALHAENERLRDIEQQFWKSNWRPPTKAEWEALLEENESLKSTGINFDLVAQANRRREELNEANAERDEAKRLESYWEKVSSVLRDDNTNLLAEIERLKGEPYGDAWCIKTPSDDWLLHTLAEFEPDAWALYFLRNLDGKINSPDAIMRERNKGYDAVMVQVIRREEKA